MLSVRIKVWGSNVLGNVDGHNIAPSPYRTFSSLSQLLYVTHGTRPSPLTSPNFTAASLTALNVSCWRS